MKVYIVQTDWQNHEAIESVYSTAGEAEAEAVRLRENLEKDEYGHLTKVFVSIHDVRGVQNEQD